MSAVGWLGGPSMFEGKDERKMGRALSASLILHGVFVACILVLMSYKGNATEQVRPPEKIDFVYLEKPPAPGGGGGGSPQPAPAKKLEIPQPKPEVVQPAVTPPPVPIPTLNAPITTMSDMLQASGNSAISSLLGGGGRGTGIGSGTGSGFGPGSGGGTGGGVFQPGTGIKDPTLLREQKPIYTAEAIRAKLQGEVYMDVTVLPDGSVDPNTIVITKSLDRQFGLDEQAIAAAKLFRFVPGINLKTGERVAVRVTIVMTFTLREPLPSGT
jgi:protein TonB